MEKEKTKIIITREGGLIQSIVTNKKDDVEIIVVDMDSEDVPDEDIISDAVKDLLKKEIGNMDEIDFNLYISDESIL